VILHRDDRLMPTRKKVWASWNYLRSSDQRSDANVAVSYWMNRLQGIDPPNRSSSRSIPTASRGRSWCLANSATTTRSLATMPWTFRRGCKAIQGDNNTQFAGAWTGYGFHEDGLTSGIAAAEALGATLPGATASAARDGGRLIMNAPHANAV
jgi:predicted NAD/FAD-binding protein